MMDSDALLSGIFIEGELSNCNIHSSGHIYFTLKDESSSISGVMFKGHADSLKVTPKSGMKVIVFGSLSLFEKTGQYQVYVELLEPLGVGSLQMAFSQLCEKLRNEGLFDSGHKRPIPRFIKCIAVITSPTGAAIQDIIRIIRTKNPVVKIVVSPATVQGDGAAEDIIRALDEVNTWGGADVIIIGRGGGSVEDLWAFNDEHLARAIATSKTPTISAVGHETDFVITDFVADMRAPTPTAAAQIAAYDHAQTMSFLKAMYKELIEITISKISASYNKTKILYEQLNSNIKERLVTERKNLTYQETLLEKVSPYTIFKRGYALVHAKEENRRIATINDVSINQNLMLYWQDGHAITEVKEVFRENRENNEKEK